MLESRKVRDYELGQSHRDARDASSQSAGPKEDMIEVLEHEIARGSGGLSDATRGAPLVAAACSSLAHARAGLEEEAACP